MFFFYSWWTYVIVIPGLLLGVWAQIRVHTTFAKYNAVNAMSGRTASDLSRMLLERGGCAGVQVQMTRGHLTDNYNPKTQVLSLSESTYHSSSIASLGVAAHEVGHAIQHEEEYTPLRLRAALVPLTNLGTMAAVPLVLAGMLIELLFEATFASTFGTVLIALGVIGYGLATVFALITLPVEFNASRRAKKMLVETGVLTEDEGRGAARVLSAAALTYVASFVTSLLYFLRFLVIIAQFRKKD